MASYTIEWKSSTRKELRKLPPQTIKRIVTAVTPADADFFADLYPIVQELVVEFDLEKPGYTLLVNGGAYQDVPHLHFHLISGVSTKSGD